MVRLKSGRQSAASTAKCDIRLTVIWQYFVKRLSDPLAYPRERSCQRKGERLIWLEDATADRLATMRGPGESYSDVILRLVELETKGRP
jgi:hypothetical protein